MYKKIFVVLLVVIMCFAVVKCKGDREEKKYMIVGEWDIARNVSYDLKPIFREDATCTIDGKEYTWELEEFRNKVTEYRVYNEKKVVYKVDLAYGDLTEGYTCIYVGKHDEYGFISADGRYYRSSDYIE